MKKVIFSFAFFISLIAGDVESQQRGEAAALFKGLELSAEQRSQIQKMRGTREEIRSLGEEAKTERQTLMKMLRSHDSSDDEVQAQLGKVINSAKKVMEKRVGAMLEFRKILSREQYVRFTERIAARMKHSRGRGESGEL